MPKNKKIIIANWKMNPETVGEAIKLIKDIDKNVSKIKKVSQIIICPPFPFLSEVKKNVSQNKKNILIGAQDCFFEEKGDYTAKVSCKMLRSLGVKYVIIGHLEKILLGETNENINKKIKIILKNNLKAILCVGEKERDASGEYFKEIKNQLKERLRGVNRRFFKSIIIAYEPAWSMSWFAKSRCLTSCETSEMALFIKKILTEIGGREAGLSVQIVYGGSVNHKVSTQLIKNGGIDGFTIGRNSLNSDKFLEIIRTTC